MSAAAQIFPLGYGNFQVVKRQRPPYKHPRQQQFWEQSNSAEIRPDSRDPNVPTEVMVQPELNVAPPFARNSPAVLAEIDGLAAGIEGEARPTDYAYTRARSFVESSYGQIRRAENVPGILPEVSVTTDDLGGVRLAWRLGAKQVRANFGANENLRSYLYFESALEHHVEALDVQHLVGGLDWLTKK